MIRITEIVNNRRIKRNKTSPFLRMGSYLPRPQKELYLKKEMPALVIN